MSLQGPGAREVLPAVSAISAVGLLLILLAVRGVVMLLGLQGIAPRPQPPQLRRVVIRGSAGYRLLSFRVIVAAIPVIVIARHRIEIRALLVRPIRQQAGFELVHPRRDGLRLQHDFHLIVNI